MTPTSHFLQHRDPALRLGPGALGVYSSGPRQRLADGVVGRNSENLEVAWLLVAARAQRGGEGRPAQYLVPMPVNELQRVKRA